MPGDAHTGVPDFRAELVASAVDSDTAWAGWRWHGTHGSRLKMAGVMVMGVRNASIRWARRYVEPVEAAEGIDAAVRELSGRE